MRTLLRNDEIVPFGTGLAFDPHTWVIKETEYGFRIWLALGERSISREIMLDRYERDEVAFVQATVAPGDRVVDVGANIGFYTALLAALVGPAGRVVACEPLDLVADALERTVHENGFEERVTVLRVALDAQRGNARLRYAPVTINAGAAYLAPAAALPPGHIDADVAALTLDDVVGDGQCRFVKLDAEGAEPRSVRRHGHPHRPCGRGVLHLARRSQPAKRKVAAPATPTSSAIRAPSSGCSLRKASSSP